MSFDRLRTNGAGQDENGGDGGITGRRRRIRIDEAAEKGSSWGEWGKDVMEITERDFGGIDIG